MDVILMMLGMGASVVSAFALSESLGSWQEAKIWVAMLILSTLIIIISIKNITNKRRKK